MYGWLWRSLPGNAWLRAVQCLVLALSVVVILLFLVFPAIEPHLPFSHVTVDQ